MIASAGPAVRGQDLAPRSYVITPVRSNDVTASYSYNDGNLLIEGAVPITGATGNPMIAPFFADVDTRGGAATATPGGTSTGSNVIYYDLDTVNRIFTVTWDDVGYFDWNTDKLNAFQLQIIGRGNGNLDIVFRYENINWTTGDFSGGYAGLGATVARAGFSTGDGQSWYELAQSGFQDAMLELESTAGNTGISGYYRFSVSSGTAASESRSKRKSARYRPTKSKTRQPCLP